MREPSKRRPVPEPLEGRVALITGGGSGVGANIARVLADAGMDVWVTGRTEARIEAVAAQIGGHALGAEGIEAGARSSPSSTATPPRARTPPTAREGQSARLPRIAQRRARKPRGCGRAAVDMTSVHLRSSLVLF